MIFFFSLYLWMSELKFPSFVSTFPFDIGLSSASEQKYQACMVQLICFVLRAHSSTDLADNVFPDALHVAMQRLKLALDAFSPDDPALQASLVTLIHGVVRLLFGRSWRQAGSTGIADPTIRFVAASMMRSADGQMAPPKHVTPLLAKLQYAVRVAALVEMHGGPQPSGVQQDHLHVFNDTVRPWVIEDSMTTFSRLRSLTLRASAIAWRTTEPPLLYFPHVTDRSEVICDGITVAFHQLQDMVREMQNEAGAAIRKLCFLHRYQVKHGLLFDDLRTTTTGYSVFTDPRNKEVNDTRIHVREFLSHPNVFQELFFLSPEGVPQVRVAAARSWLEALARLELLILTEAHLTGGGQARGTEICAMTVRNTPSSRRNVYMIGNILAFVGIVTKTSSTQRTEQYIPHAFSAFSAEVVKLIHCLFRPLARILARSCFPNPVVRARAQAGYNSLLFCNFGGVPFGTVDITSTLQRWTSLHLHVSWGVRMMRHVAMNWRRALLLGDRFMQAPAVWEDEEEDTLPVLDELEFEALQNHHSISVDASTYALTADSLPNMHTAAVVMHTRNSGLWQSALLLVPAHAGNGLPWWELLPSQFPALQREYRIEAIDPVTPQERFRNSIVRDVNAMFKEVVMERDRAMLSNSDALEERLAGKLSIVMDEITGFVSQVHDLELGVQSLLEVSHAFSLEDYLLFLSRARIYRPSGPPFQNVPVPRRSFLGDLCQMRWRI